MKQTIIILFALLFLSACNKKAHNPIQKQTITDYLRIHENKQSIDYKSTVDFSFFSEPDTFRFQTKIKTLNVKEDTLFGGYYWIEKFGGDSLQYIKYYDLDSIYVIWPKEQTITTYDAHHGENYVLFGGMESHALYPNFTNESKWKKRFTDSLSDVTLNPLHDSKVEVVVKKPDDEEYDYSNSTQKYIIRKDTLLSYQFDIDYMENQHQYSKVVYDSISFNRLQKSDFDRLFSQYDSFEMKSYEPFDPNKRDSLANGAAAPNFSAKLYKNGEEIQLEDYRGNVLLIDFWYMGCPPCVAAIPELNKLQEDYQNKGLKVLGLNPTDTLPNEIFEKFSEKMDFQYQIASIERKVASDDYKVFAYPTFYIIDKNGIIQYQSFGYGETTREEIEPILEELLQE